MSTSRKAIVFTVNEEELAVWVDDVISVEKVEPLEVIPELPDYVRGIKEVRGQQVPVIDLGEVLYKETCVNDDLSRYIVIHTSDLPIAIQVKDAKEMIDIPNDSLKNHDLIVNEKTFYMSSVANLNGRLVMLMDPNSFLNGVDREFQIRNYMKEQISNT